MALRSGIVAGLLLVVAASAAHPLAHGLSARQSAVALLIVAPAAFLPGLVAHFLARLVAGYRANRRRIIGVAFVIGAVAIGIITTGLLPDRGVFTPPRRVPQPAPPHHTPSTSATSTHYVDLLTQVGIVLMVIALLAGAGVVLVLMLRKRKPALPLTSLAPEPLPEPESIVRRVYSLLGDTLDDLRQEPDPRKAVIAAYARMELGLGELGIDRRRSETPFEYLAEVLQAVSVSGSAARRLTDLFERAKFSPASVAPAMKVAAIDALSAIREEVVASVA